MNTVSYDKLFEVKLLHSFFTKGKPNCFEFTLGKNSRLLAKQYGFRFENSSNSIVCYPTKTNSIEELLNYVKTKEVSYFDFDVSITDDNFFNYTELPLDWTGILMYDSQYDKNIIKDSNLILTPQFKATIGSQYFLNIRIHFGTILTALNHQKNLPEFRIEFKSRKSIWEYFIIDRTSVVGKETTIIGNSEVQFNKSQVTLFNGELATKLRSNTTINFSQSNNYKFKLVNVNKQVTGLTDEPDADVIVPNLPYPSTSSINVIEFKGKETVTSPMYIYV